MSGALILSSAAAALAALTGGAGAMLLGQTRFDSRIATHVGGEPAAVRASARGPDLAPLIAGLVRLGEQAGKGALEPDKAQGLRRQLVQAGFYSEQAPQVFFGLRAVGAAGLGALGFALAVLLGQGGLNLFLLTTVGANFGLFGPKIVLNRRVQARARSLKLALPDVVELMVVCVEAGGTLGAALQRVTGEFAELYPIVQEQFGIMLMEMQAGSSRAQALARLADRSPSEEVGSLVAMLIQSEAVGAGIGGALRAYAQEMRKSRQLEAERKAAELPVKISFPLVFCIFPAMSDVLFAPVVVQLMHSSFFHH